jgi:dTDP-4-dehydrorhamnose 3,5-epimerase
MKIKPTKLAGVFLVEPEPVADDRGHFSRLWSAGEFKTLGLDPHLNQVNVSFNKTQGTLRGLHFQAAPYEETKLIRCLRGKIYDVLVDLRADSPTYLKWEGYELTSETQKMIYAPKGMAHGFLTLDDNTEVLYVMSDGYRPESAKGLRWNDPFFHISWPNEPVVISDRDNSYPSFSSPK